EVGRPALHGMRAEQRVAFAASTVVPDAAGKDRHVVRLADHDSGLWAFGLQHPGYALQRAAGAGAGHPVVEWRVGEVSENFPGCGARVEIGISLVLELAAEEPAVLCR